MNYEPVVSTSKAVYGGGESTTNDELAFRDILESRLADWVVYGGGRGWLIDG